MSFCFIQNNRLAPDKLLVVDFAWPQLLLLHKLYGEAD